MAEGAEEVPVVYLHEIKRQYVQGAAPLVILNGAKLALWAGQSVALVAPSGTGKSTLARALAPGLGRAPGALVLRSDEIRKRLHGVAPETRLPEAAYAEPVSRQVFRALAEILTRDPGDRLEALLVVWTALDDDVLRHPERLGRGQLLQRGLPVQAGAEPRGAVDHRVEEPVHEAVRGGQAAL